MYLVICIEISPTKYNDNNNMATEEHKQLSNIIKSCHNKLRHRSQQYGPDQAWQAHKNQSELLKEYAAAMHQLSQIWEKNIRNNGRLAINSRLQWIVNYCTKYFYSEVAIIYEKRRKEERLLEYLQDYDKSQCQYMNEIPEKLNVLDVGSCFNPFRDIPHFNVTAIDLFPATDDVLKCDFLRVSIKNINNPEIDEESNEVNSLPRDKYECIIFSFLLEYIPSSEQRINCCRNALKLLKSEGILIIITPDSQHVAKNAAIMKNWRYTLGCLGFTRIFFDKLPHIACMVFRKACDKRLAYKWADMHKEPYMKLDLQIPQDNKTFHIT